MARRRARWRDPGPWYGRMRDRLDFEGAARRGIAGLRSYQRPGGRGWCYRLGVEPVYCPPREVLIEFRLDDGGRYPRVFVDGPSHSPHRYHADGGHLCMWYPSDPPDRRWIFDDGLLALIGQIQVHLIKEHLWRELGEWPGDEAPHEELVEEKAA